MPVARLLAFPPAIFDLPLAGLRALFLICYNLLTREDFERQTALAAFDARLWPLLYSRPPGAMPRFQTGASSQPGARFTVIQPRAFAPRVILTAFHHRSERRRLPF